MNFLGLIFRCQNGRFVKIEKEGLFEQSTGGYLAGYAGREIDQSCKPIGDYIIWTKSGKNLRDPGWNLLETRADADSRVIEPWWPHD